MYCVGMDIVNVLKALLFLLSLLIYFVFLSVVFVVWLNSQDVNFFLKAIKLCNMFKLSEQLVSCSVYM